MRLINKFLKKLLNTARLDRLDQPIYLTPLAVDLLRNLSAIQSILGAKFSVMRHDAHIEGGLVIAHLVRRLTAPIVRL